MKKILLGLMLLMHFQGYSNCSFSAELIGDEIGCVGRTLSYTSGSMDIGSSWEFLVSDTIYSSGHLGIFDELPIIDGIPFVDSLNISLIVTYQGCSDTSSVIVLLDSLCGESDCDFNTSIYINPNVGLCNGSVTYPQPIFGIGQSFQYNCDWFKDSILIASDTLKPRMIVSDSSEIMLIATKISNGCKDTAYLTIHNAPYCVEGPCNYDINVEQTGLDCPYTNKSYSIYGGGSFDYYWKLNDSITSFKQNFNTVFNEGSIVELIVIGDSGCIDTTSLSMNIAEHCSNCLLEVEVDGYDYQCPGEWRDLYPNVVLGSNINLEYNWYYDGHFAGQEFNHHLPRLDSMEIILVTKDTATGCVDTSTVYYGDKFGSCGNEDQCLFDVDITSTCINDSISYTALINSSETPNTLKWYHESTVYNTSEVLFPKNDTGVIILYADFDDCHAYDVVSMNTNCLNTGMEEVTKATFDIFPNPTKDIVSVQSKSIKIKAIKVYNSIGMQLFSIQEISSNTNVSLVKYPKGVYLMRIEDVTGNYYVKQITKK